MAGNNEFNTNIQVKGKINLKDVPNNTPTGILVWNSEIKDIAQRTPSQFLSDLDLITATNIASAYYTKTQVDTNIKTAVDDIQIGGRNLLRKSRIDISISNNIEGFIFKNTISEPLKVGETYIFRAFNKTNDFPELVLNDGVTDYVGGQIITEGVPFVAQFPSQFIWSYHLPGNGDIYVEAIKLEKGNKATDFSPAIEDQVTDWNTTDVNDFSFLKNKPTNLSQFSNDAGYLTSSALSPYAQNSWVNDNFDKYGSWNLQTNGVQRTSMPSGSILNLVAGSNVFIAYSAGGKVIITAGNTTYVQGDGISITGSDNVITNTKPNIVQTLDGSGNTVTLSNGGGSYSIPAQSWGSITGKPATFPPDTHTHSQYVTTDTIQTITGAKTFSSSITAPAFTEGSLKSLKKNIKSFKKSGLELVEQLDIVTFDRKDGSVKNKIGIIADFSPKEFLSEELDAVDLYKTLFIQAKAIQELSKELKTLRELTLQNTP